MVNFSWFCVAQLVPERCSVLCCLSTALEERILRNSGNNSLRRRRHRRGVNGANQSADAAAAAADGAADAAAADAAASAATTDDEKAAATDKATTMNAETGETTPAGGDASADAEASPYKVVRPPPEKVRKPCLKPNLQHTNTYECVKN